MGLVAKIHVKKSPKIEKHIFRIIFSGESATRTETKAPKIPETIILLEVVGILEKIAEKYKDKISTVAFTRKKTSI